MPVTFRALPGGGDPLSVVIQLREDMKVQQADLSYALERQKTRILDRTTIQGVDCDGTLFAPYSTKGPYYYYPGGPGAGRTVKQRKSAVNRLLKRTGGIAEMRSEYLGSSSIGGVKTRSGLGIRFESYADFKASLGRRGVDLTGPRAPHMLQTMMVHLTGPGEGAIGIYDPEKAAIAEGHQNGAAHLPRRAFIGAGERDIEAIATDLVERITARLMR
jgi:hypothetical protein